MWREKKEGKKSKQTKSLNVWWRTVPYLHEEGGSGIRRMNEGVKAILTWFESLVVVESCVWQFHEQWASSCSRERGLGSKKLTRKIDPIYQSQITSLTRLLHHHDDEEEKALNNCCEWKNGGQSSSTTDISSAGRKQVKHREEEGKVGWEQIHIVHIQLALMVFAAANFCCRSN